MKEKVCCIFDENERYAVKLSDYINDSRILPYQAMAFSSEEALAGCIGKYDIEFLLAGKELGDEISESQDIHLYLRLVDRKEGNENEIYRFQSAENIVQDVVSHISGFSRNLGIKYGTSVISVYSPATKCFKTTFSLCLASVAAEKGRTLWLGFEQFSGLSELLPSPKGGLSEALYYYYVDGKSSYGKIAGCTGNIEGFDYLSPVLCADDIADIDSGEIVKFIDMVGKEGAYDRIIIDAGCLINRPWQLLDASEKIIMPKPLDYMGKKKEKEFENYLQMSGRSGIMGAISKAEIPYEESMAGYEILSSSLENRKIREFAGRFIDG